MCILLLLPFNWIDTLNKWGTLLQEFFRLFKSIVTIFNSNGSVNKTEKDELLPSASQKL